MASSTGSKIALLAVVAAIGGLYWYSMRPVPVIVQGQVNSNRFDISPRVSGRVVDLKVDVGDTVRKGEILAVLDNPDLRAQRVIQKAAVDVAVANFEVITTVRPEDVASKTAAVESTKATLRLAQQTFDRQSRLVRTGSAAIANLDAARSKRDEASKAVDQAVAALALTQQGATTQQRDLATAQIEQAKASLAATETSLAELTIYAPTDGQITTRPAELGVNVSVGSPLLSLIDLNKLWLTFNIREDLLNGVKVGDEYEVIIPGLNERTIKAKVSLINVQGQYATWRATRATGDFDLRTFEVRADPSEPVDGLRPGMSAVVSKRKPGQ